ncbi:MULTISPECIES: hypothetical protein [Enterobacter]|uniref:hypothetical protein n=1 Tax=Enterobacter TaxID=547 RepID=UPI000F8402B9|nr:MULTISPECIES: hypothetical protein [Enterobacter]MBE3288349.1 hypothetical protein [Enterobacter cloacae complex sp. P31C]RTM28416.1 hypothetical protein EKO14_16840 [Enterobacter bugandensis]
MKKPNGITLKLGGTHPDSLPAGKLAKYLSIITDMYGQVDHVHLESVSEGSADVNVWVDNEAAYNDVISRSVSQAKSNGKHYQRLISQLDEDGFTGSIFDRNSSLIIKIPTSKKEEPFNLNKNSEVQGRLYSVGGKDDSIPVKLEGANGETYHCEATPDLALKLGMLLFRTLRVKGEGHWERKDGKWKLKKLKISSFEELKKIKLKDARSQIVQTTGNQWSEEDDPASILAALRKLNCE